MHAEQLIGWLLAGRLLAGRLLAGRALPGRALPGRLLSEAAAEPPHLLQGVLRDVPGAGR